MHVVIYYIWRIKKVSYGPLSLNYDFRGGLPRIFRASSADLPRCRQNCFFWIGGHAVAPRWPATRWPPSSPPPGGHPVAPGWHQGIFRGLPVATLRPRGGLPRRVVAFPGGSSAGHLGPPGGTPVAFRRGLPRGSSADLPRIFRGSSAVQVE